MMPHHTTPPPPSVLSQQALLLDTISNLIDLARADGNRVLRELPRTAPCSASSISSPHSDICARPPC